MTPVVRFLPEALDDVIESQRWYASRQPGLGQSFAEAITAGVERIASNPAAFPYVHGSVRRLVVRQFPYAIYFREAGDAIVVLAVHGRQDPRLWQGRA
jgi:plasmid stabilization system protein ParE